MITEYAARNGMDVIRTYAQEGKSGLRFDGRDSLKRLIDDVNSPDRDFDCILVHDVNRWSKFEDADASATASMYAGARELRPTTAPSSSPMTAALCPRS